MLRQLRKSAGLFPFVVLFSWVSLAASRPGDIIRSEPMQAPAGASAWKIVYASTGLNGEPIQVTGIVVAPSTPAPAGGRPVVAWAHPTTGVAEKCAPSLLPTVFQKIPELDTLIAHGYVVAATDYPGLGSPGTHPYLIGLSEGRAVLDSVRAAGHLSGASAGPRFIVWGHSQGGHAALFAGQIAASYAPELKLVGVAAAAPATDLAQLLRDDITEPVGRVLTAYALYSWSQVFNTPLAQVTHQPAIPIVKRLAGDCAESTQEGYKLSFDAFTLTPRMLLPGFYNAQPWSRVLADNVPGHAPAGAPVYIAQGTTDKIVLPAVTQKFVQDLCSRGEKVVFDQLPGVGHMTSGKDSATAAIEWMTALFDNKAPASTCSGH